MYSIYLWRHYLYVQVENICTVFNNICLLKTTKVRIELLERELFQFLFTISDSDFKTQLFNLQVFSLCGSTFLTSIKTPIQFTKLHTITNAPYFLLSMNSINYFSFLSCWSSIQVMNTLINIKSCTGKYYRYSKALFISDVFRLLLLSSKLRSLRSSHATLYFRYFNAYVSLYHYIRMVATFPKSYRRCNCYVPFTSIV